MAALIERLDYLARWHDDEHDTIWQSQQRIAALERLVRDVDAELAAGRPDVAHVLVRTALAEERNRIANAAGGVST